MNNVLNDTLQTCKACSVKGTGNYCSVCGEKYITKRITLHGLFHEVFHFFTHFDKGLPLTVKQLIVKPGVPQKSYVEGVRSLYQKPFSMFFICASLSALAMYYINYVVVHYLNGGDSQEVNFFHKYWVLLQTCMLPIYIFITYIIFKRSKYNYAETAILQLYLFSMIFLILIIIHLLKLIWPDIQTRYIELPVFVVYTIFSYINFYSNFSKIKIIILSLVSIVITFLLATTIQDYLVKRFF